jgi:hypothetical protein
MAILMNVSFEDYQAKFMAMGLSSNPIAKLNAQSATISTAFYLITIERPGLPTVTFKPAVPSSSLFKDGNESSMALVHDWMRECANVGLTNTLKPKKSTAGAILAKFSENPDAKLVIEHPALASTYVKAEDSSKLVSLATASHLGQSVMGTNAESVYRVVGLGPRLRMAVRKAEKDTMSLRVELSGDSYSIEETTVLVKAGFTKAGAHYSMHAMLDSCPPARLLGAVMLELGLLLPTRISNLGEVSL